MFAEKARWRLLLTASHGALVLLSLGFTSCALRADDACYVEPCYEGEGLQELWKVNKGVGFTGVAAGVFSTAIASVGLALFGWAALDPRREAGAGVLVGVFLGATACTALLMLDQFAVWCAEWNLVGDLTDLSPDNAVFHESGRTMHVHRDLLVTFKALVGLAAATGAVQVGVVAQLALAQHDVTAHLRLRGGTSEREIATEKQPLRAMHGDIHV